MGWGYEDERMYRDFVYLSVTVVWYGPLSRPVRQLASESVSKPASQAFFFRLVSTTTLLSFRRAARQHDPDGQGEDEECAEPDPLGDKSLPCGEEHATAQGKEGKHRDLNLAERHVALLARLLLLPVVCADGWMDEWMDDARSFLFQQQQHFNFLTRESKCRSTLW